jgi:Leucine-rich repeat (LRR) protein
MFKLMFFRLDITKKGDTMWKFIVFNLVCIVSLTFAQDDADSVKNSVKSADSPASVDESPIVKTILEKCGLNNKAVADVAVLENGRVVSLDLSNKDVAKDGIKLIPSEIGQLTSLRILICKNNNISLIPVEIANCSQLVKLDLNSNVITELPLEIGRLTNLTDLDLRYNLIGELPYTIGNLKQLEILRLWGNMLSSITPFITNIPVLKELYLKDNRLTSLPEGITTMKSLKYIDIIGNKLCSVEPKVDAWLKIKDKLYVQTQKCW